jgi:hypothetical protein
MNPVFPARTSTSPLRSRWFVLRKVIGRLPLLGTVLVHAHDRDALVLRGVRDEPRHVAADDTFSESRPEGSA